MYPALGIANYFLGLANRDGETLPQLKLQKLIYLAHGWTLAILDRPLILEKVEAWERGPVIRVVYDAFKHFGRHPIDEPAKIFTGIFRDELQFELPPTIEPSDQKTRALVEKVWETYKPYSGATLSARTHEDGTPWDRVWNDPSIPHHGIKVIDDERIKESFRAMIKPSPGNGK